MTDTDIQSILVIKRDDEERYYRIDDHGFEGLHTTRVPESEYGFNRVWTWKRFATVVAAGYGNVHGLDPREVEALAPD